MIFKPGSIFDTEFQCKKNSEGFLEVRFDLEDKHNILDFGTANVGELS